MTGFGVGWSVAVHVVIDVGVSGHGLGFTAVENKSIKVSILSIFYFAHCCRVWERLR